METRGDRLDDLYIANARAVIKSAQAQPKGQTYRLELLDHEKNLRSQYDKGCLLYRPSTKMRSANLASGRITLS